MLNGTWMEALEPRRLLSGVGAGIDGGAILASSSGQYHSALNDQRFVNQLYLDLLGRRPSGSEWNAAETALGSGATTQSIAQGVTGTPEYHEDVVKGLYESLLRRSPSGGEEGGFVSLLNSGGSVAQVRSSIASSSEYFYSECGGDFSQYINLIFQDVIGRAPSVDELATYVTALNDLSTTRASVAQNLVMSVPGQGHWVQGSYQHLLHRAPTADELNTATDELRASVSEAQVLSEIAGTQEYYVGASTGVIVTGTQAGAPPNVKVFNALTGQLQFSFMAYDVNYLGGVRVASADVNGDGIPDIITAPGPGAPPNVRVFDGTTGKPMAGPLGSFFAYDPAFLGGVQVAAGDVNGDGFADIITAPDASVAAGPNVKVFSGADGSLLNSFWAYDSNFHGGVRVAAGDVNGDGYADIITGPGSATSNVKVFSGQDLSVLDSFFAYEPDFSGGVYVGGGDVDGVGHDDIVVTRGAGTPSVTIFNSVNLQPVHEYNAYDPSFFGGVTVGVVDANIDGHDDVITGPASSADPHVKICDCSEDVEYLNFEAYDTSYLGGITVAGGRRLV